MPKRQFVLRSLFAVSLLPLLSLTQAIAGPPEGVSGKMVLDEVADGLRRYQMEKDEERRTTWLWRLSKYHDLRVAVVMGEALSDPSEEVQFAASVGLLMCRGGPVVHRRQWANPTLFQVEWMECAKEYWRQGETELRRRAKQLPQ